MAKTLPSLSSTSTATLLQNKWQTLAPRERLGLGWAMVLVGAALLWWLAISPALQTLRHAGAQQVVLESQLQQMQAMQTEAKALQNQAKISPADAQKALEAAVKKIGPNAQMNLLGERATITFKSAPGDALALWLAEARANARALPVEAKLSKAPAPAPAPTAPSSAAPAAPTAPVVAWDGSIVVRLP